VRGVFETHDFPQGAKPELSGAILRPPFGFAQGRLKVVPFQSRRAWLAAINDAQKPVAIAGLA